MSFLKKFFEKDAVKATVVPFAVTRLLLIISGLVAPLFAPVSDGQNLETATRGWDFTSIRLIDMWARWDSGWYLFTIKNGYSMGESVFVTSNLPFFPVFPLMVKVVSYLVPVRPVPDVVLITIGILLTNTLLLLGAYYLYKLTRVYFSKSVAQNTIWFLMVFPAAFFLSSFYTESVFFVFSVMSLWFATQKQWWLAGLMAAVVSGTRPLGALIGIPLLLEYMAQREWKFSKIDVKILSFGLVPVGLLAFLSYMYFLTGDFFAPVKAQAAWGRGTADPFTSFVFPAASWAYLTPFDQLFGLTAVVTGIALLLEKSRKYWMLGSFALVMILPAFFTGTLDSVTRFVAVLFPVFMYWAYLLDKNCKVSMVLKAVLLAIQLVFFAMFTQFYWVG
jgi:hypothetical protein